MKVQPGQQRVPIPYLLLFNLLLQPLLFLPRNPRHIQLKNLPPLPFPITLHNLPLLFFHLPLLFAPLKPHTNQLKIPQIPNPRLFPPGHLPLPNPLPGILPLPLQPLNLLPLRKQIANRALAAKQVPVARAGDDRRARRLEAEAT